MSASAHSLLHVLHVASPSLPIGAFAYSQGLEYALDQRWCDNKDDVQQWLHTTLTHGLGELDLPITSRLHQAWQADDQTAVNDWNARLLAYRETKELYLEDIQVGAAFLQWHKNQSTDHDARLDWLSQPTYAAMFSLHCVQKNISVRDTLLAYAWAWLDNQIIVANKTMPMGQTDGQHIIADLIDAIASSVERAMCLQDHELGSSLPGLAMASALHEHQYSRLFRS